jgi:hypothetical protein
MTIKLLKQARAALEEHNAQLKSLADSGDAGFWKAEDRPEYNQAWDAINAIDAYLLDRKAKKNA